MRKLAILAAALTCAALITLAQEKKPAPESKPGDSPQGEFKIPPEEVKRENPVSPTSAGLAAAKRFYTIECAMCHGGDGSGKSDLAEQMKLTLRDWRQPDALKGMTDGELRYIISSGKGKMPGEGKRAKPDQLWQLVNYVRAFAKKEGGQ